MAFTVPQIQWRQLSPDEVKLLLATYACERAAATGNHQSRNGQTVTEFSCNGIRFMNIMRGSDSRYYVLNHPGAIRPTGIARPQEEVMQVMQHWPSVGAGKPGLGDASTDQQNADAKAMNDSLIDHGYKQADQYLYRAFQQDVGLTPDGFPGAKTMQELKDVLFAMGIEIADVPVYPWLASGGYDGINAPLWQDWAPGQAMPSATPATPSGGGTYTAPVTTITPSAPSSGPSKAMLLVGGAVAAVAAGGGYLYWRKHHRR